MLDFKELENINARLEKIDIKGKEYVGVNQRILAFRQLFPSGSIETEVLSAADGVVTIKAIVRDNEGKIVSVGHAQEKEDGSFINKTSHVENCETSAVGRALGILGIGATEAIRSAEEEINALLNGKNAVKKMIELTCENCGNQIVGVKCGEDPTKDRTAEQIAEGSKEKYGVKLCMKCSKKRADEGKSQ